MRYDHFSMLPARAFQKRAFGGMTLEGGGGGGPTSSTVTQTNIPEWLRPQTEALLGAATKEYFQTREIPGKAAKYDEEGREISPATESTFEITGVKPFTPYSTRPGDYVAEFSPLQQQMQFEAANMMRPEGFEYGSGMTAAAGQGGFDAARLAGQYGGAGFESGMLGQRLGTEGGGYYGGMGAGYGAQAAGMAPEAQRYGRSAADIGQMGLRAEALGRDVGEEARGFARQAAGTGQQYAQMATDPRSIQAYMSPYMQNVLDTQKQAAILDAQKAQLAANLAAPRTGTAGGSRQALMTAERERGLQTALGNIQAQGMQKAYEDAQRAQQFGITAGLQGLQGAQQGLGTALSGGQLGLGGIGQAIAGQQAGMQSLGQAGQLYGLGMQGAETGLRGVQQQLAGTAQGMQGAGMGLQGIDRTISGLGLGATAGRSVADIANMMQGADINRMRFQGEVGSEQRQREQAIINQAIQNFAQAEMTPFERLSGYNALLRGYATPTTTTSSYMAPPSPFSQVVGAGTTLAALQGMGGKKKGGKVKEKKYASGGITDIDQKVINDPTSFSAKMLNQGMANKVISKMAGAIGLSELERASQQAKQNQALAQPAPQGTVLGDLQQKVMAQGIESAPTRLPTRLAGGGIVAFEDGGPIRFQNKGLVDFPSFDELAPAGQDATVPGNRISQFFSSMSPDQRRIDPVTGEAVTLGEYLRRLEQRKVRAAQAALPTPPAAAAAPAAAPPTGAPSAAAPTPPAAAPAAPAAAPAAPQSISELTPAAFKQQMKDFGVPEDSMAKTREQLAALMGESKLDRAQARNMALLTAGLGMMGGTSRYALQNIGQGAMAGAAQYGRDIKDIKSAERDLFKMQAELEKADDARARGDFKAFQDHNEKARDYSLKLKKEGREERTAAAYERIAGRPSEEQLRQQMFAQDPAKFKEYQAAMRPGFETAGMQKDKIALEQINNALLTMKKDDPQRKILEAQRQEIMSRLSGLATQGPPVPPNVQAILDKYMAAPR